MSDGSTQGSTQAQQLQIGMVYRHYKTKGLYLALQLVTNTGDGQDDKTMVLYWSLSANRMFVRPLEEFTAKIHSPDAERVEDRFVFRFELLNPQP